MVNRLWARVTLVALCLAVMSPPSSFAATVAEFEPWRTRRAGSSSDRSQPPSELNQLPALIVREPTELFSPLDELLGVAQPGEFFVLLALEADWALAHKEDDVPELAVWIARDARVELVVRWIPPERVPTRLALSAAAAPHWENAIATQRSTQANLRVLGDAPSCELARIVSFRRSDVEREIADQWYVSSQLWADANLLPMSGHAGDAFIHAHRASVDLDQSTETETRCQLEKGFAFLDRMWSYEVAGYYPRSNPTGTAIEQGPRYADDNSLVGLALLATAEVTSDESAARRHTYAARRAADFLIHGGLWDDTFGGGFWWNTGRGDTAEGKPAQTNALAALFFGRLYQATGDEFYRTWSMRTLEWLDRALFEPSIQLYRWSVAYEQPAFRQGMVRSDSFFNYDQGIALEAQLLAHGLDGDISHQDRARNVGHAMHGAFWSAERGGYNLQAGVEQVFTSYAAWTSLGHLALFDFDANPQWLDLARLNVEALMAGLQERDGGYAYRWFRCVDSATPDCVNGPGAWVVDHTRDTSAQAWMQHLQTAIAHRLQQHALALESQDAG